MRHRLVLVAATVFGLTFVAARAGAEEAAPPAPATTTPAAATPAAATPAAATTPATTPPAAAPGATTTTATTTDAAAPATDAQPAQTADEEYDLKMRELEDMVAELKEQIFRSKAKLQLLAEQVSGGIGTGAKIVIVHKNEMGPNFLLVEANYYLDGQPLWQEVDAAGTKLTAKKELPVWDGNIVEGSHTLTVNLVYKGDGTGVFRYLSAYSWKLKDSITFTAEPGKVVTIDAVGFEQGNFTTQLEERPRIRFDTSITNDTRVEKKDQGSTP